ncbi:HEAT repeat domain-containing protein [Brasilonema sp. UFV-L1]|uniref:HEAT repeat domain-containing protein n=1 Tax=Brasilonema sp. UFV-L1 TaxID=2234130 RepID=UPI00145F32C8|nr:HEAT repeat domain-containing protein [Brasilonema sp. UFV-L1]NMG07905.1 HEAT repeat domain-containing protein [Brasilonema sp. UFV-L1]
MLKTNQKIRKLSPIFLFPFTVFLVLLLSLPWVNAKEAPKPKPQDWEIKGIVAALRDPGANVRLKAADKLALYQLDNPNSLIQNYKDVVDELGKQLEDKDAVSLNAAAVALGQMQAKDYTSKIAELLKNSDINVRSAAAAALGQMQAREYASTLVELLKDSDINVRNAAVEALGQMQATEVAPTVVELLKNSDVSVRNAAVEALGQIQATEYTSTLVELLKDSDISVRNAAAEALGQMQAKEVAPTLVELLKDSNISVQYASARALGQMQATEVAPKIAELLKDSDSSVRNAAADALGQIQAKEYTSTLVGLLKDVSVRNTALEALGQMQAKEYAPNKVAELLKDSDISVRNTAAFALGQMQAKEVAPNKIAELLKDSDSSVRNTAVVVLGQTQAKEVASKKIAELLKDSDISVRNAAALALGQMQAKEYASTLAELLKNSNISVRYTAARALGQMQAKEYAPQLAELLKDSDSSVRNAAVEALAKLEQQDFSFVVQVLDVVQQYPSEVGQLRFLAHFIGSGEQDVEPLMQWVGKPKSKPEKLTREQGKKTMEVFEKTWKLSESLPDLRQELAAEIAEVAKKVSWKAQDITLLQNHYKRLQKAKSTQADAVKSVINNLEFWKYFFKARNTILIHASFWLALIFAYPKFPQIQAIFFWNPWVRRILGVGYVGFLLTWVPFLRRKLFEPFKPSLLADAGLDNFNLQAYFPESKVKYLGLLGSGKNKAITEALPKINGQIVLIGDSGLGKSMFLRYLAKTSEQIVVYLPAQKCEKGVIEAIQAKLHGHAQDAEFLKNLIYSGAIDIYIDGLNEVTADTRAKITQFVEFYFRGNIIMTTQPLEWIPPSTAKVYELQPLEGEQIEQFLSLRQLRLPKDAKVQGDKYQQAYKNYLADALKEQQSPEELDAAQKILSNPMDLSLVALMLSQGKQPNLFYLQEEQYNLMAAEYQREWNQEFPLKKFSEAVYEMRLNEQQALPADEFYQALISLEDEKYKMVVSRQWLDDKGEAKKEWYFRHDKIMDFFLLQNFLGKGEEVEKRLIDHMTKPHFHGVYYLLATLLELDAAKELRERLIQYAANIKDHAVSDTFVQLLRAR